MKQNDIIRMAHEAGGLVYGSPKNLETVIDVMFTPETIERFISNVAAFAAEKEREDCAKLLDEMKECAEELMEHPDYSGRFEYERMLALEDAAEAIRNRGKETK